MNIDSEYAEKKKQRESQLCQQLLSQCENKQLIYDKGCFDFISMSVQAW